MRKKWATIVWTPTCHSISYSIPFHLTALLPLSTQQSTLRPSQQHLNRHSKPLSHSFLLCLLLQTKKTAPDKRNYILEATAVSSANQPMAEQADQQ